ncbi:hypothetical protein K8T06_10715, partial [bacterium]|nr:hypothetical protein [bacterium]
PELDLDIQAQLWKKLLTQLDDWKKIAHQFQENTDQIFSRFPEAVQDLSQIQSYLRTLAQLAKSIPNKESITPDWADFLPGYSQLKEPEKLALILKKLRSFNEIGISPYLASRSYLFDTRLNLPDNLKYDPLKTLHKHAVDASSFSDDLVLHQGLKIFLDRFERFRQAYTEYYVEEHEAKNQWIMAQKYEAVSCSLEARILEQLQSIPVIRRTCPSRKAMLTALSADKQKCSLNPETVLAAFPVCRCDFKLADPPGIPSPVLLKNQIVSQVKMALEIIQSKEVSNKLLDLLSGKKSFNQQRLTALLSIKSEDRNFLERLSNLLDNDIVSSLKQIDSIRNYKTVVHLNGLATLLEGQTLTLDQARKKVLEWLENKPGLQDDDWVHFED